MEPGQQALTTVSCCISPDSLQTRTKHLEELRGEVSVAELCRCEAIAESVYYRWSKAFLEAGKSRLAGDTQWQATSSIPIILVIPFQRYYVRAILGTGLSD